MAVNLQTLVNFRTFLLLLTFNIVELVLLLLPDHYFMTASVHLVKYM